MQLRLAQKRLGVRNMSSLGKVLSGATTTDIPTLRFCSSLPAFFPCSFLVLGEMHCGGKWILQPHCLILLSKIVLEVA